jgi:hypothetical protein
MIKDKYLYLYQITPRFIHLFIRSFIYSFVRSFDPIDHKHLPYNIPVELKSKSRTSPIRTQKNKIEEKKADDRPTIRSER